MAKKKPAKKKKPVRRSTAPKKKTSDRYLRLILRFLVVVLILVFIAYVASYVFLRSSSTVPPVKKELRADDTSNADISSESRTPTNNQFVVSVLDGTWVSTENGALFTIDRGGYTLEVPSVENTDPLKGNILVTDFRIELVGASTSVCAGISGIYSFQLHEDEIMLALQADSCIRRSQLLEGKWFKL